MAEPSIKKELFKTIILVIICCLVIIGLFYLTKIVPTSSIEVYSIGSSSGLDPSKIFNKDLWSTNPTENNILLLGQAGPGYPGGDLTDTIIIGHLSARKQQIFLISLPRDLLVKIPNQENFTKINTLYSLFSIEKLNEKIQGITGLTINHYIVIDLIAAEEIINLIDGLNVYVPQDIYDPYFPGPNYSYQNFTLKAGWRYLDGETTLKYIRTRYTSPNGDFDRMARQQQIIQLLKQKILALNPLWDFTTYLKIFNSLNNHIKTDLSLLEMKSLCGLIKNIKPEQINNIVIDKKETGLLTSSSFVLGQETASVVYPLSGLENYQIIKDYIQSNIH